MNNSSSSGASFFTIPLTPQTTFPFTIRQGFSRSQNTTTLTLTDNFWGNAGTEGYAVKDAFSGKVLFRVETSVGGVAPREKTKWLVDTASNAPIARLNEVWTSTTAYDLYACEDGDDDRLTQSEIAFLPFCDDPCKAFIEDPETGAMRAVGMYGLWSEHLAYIYLNRGMAEWGERQAIAKVFRADSSEATFSSAEYHVEITFGVDIAFIVMICAALDNALQRNEDKVSE